VSASPADSEVYYTAQEAIERLGVPRSTFYYLVAQGRINKVRFGQRKQGVYRREQIDRLARGDNPADIERLVSAALTTAGLPLRQEVRARGLFPVDLVVAFHDGESKTEQYLLVEIKAGRSTSRSVLELLGELVLYPAEMGVLITARPPSDRMQEIAVAAGEYVSSSGERYPRLQVVSLAEALLGGQGLALPDAVRSASTAALFSATAEYADEPPDLEVPMDEE
jgi:excisionase family DNA binding protein